MSRTAADDATLVRRHDAAWTSGMAYLEAHELSSPSERYVYLLWILVACFAVLLGVEHMLGLTQRTWLGAVWTKWSTMQYIPSRLAQDQSAWRRVQYALFRLSSVTLQASGLLLLGLLLLPMLCLTLIGADYIDPSVPVFDFRTNFPSPEEVQRAHNSPERRGVQWGRGDYPRVMYHLPQYTLPYHTFWSMGSRFGDFCNALTPLIVLLALKQAPFALLANPVLGRYAIGSLAFLHRWGGRVLWLYACLHTILWLVQVSHDAKVQPALWHHLLSIGRFRWALVAFVFLTLLVLLSLGPVRRRHYEFFYVGHIVCILGFMIATWAHHPQLGGWMLASILVWGCERAWRLARVLYFNVGRPRRRALQAPVDIELMAHAPLAPPPVPSKDDDSFWDASMENLPLGAAPKSPSLGGQATLPGPPAAPTKPPMLAASLRALPPPFRPVVSTDLRGELPAGYAFVQPLAGQMMRLVLRTPRGLRWRPGQWVYLMLPALSWLQTHPFTIASAYQRRDAAFVPVDLDHSAHDTDQLLLLLIRARTGLTRRLWNHVEQACQTLPPMPMDSERSPVFPSLGGPARASRVRGTYMRAIVDGPFGGTARVDWGAYSTCVIVCGGSGVTLGLAVLEYLCRKIARVLDGEDVHSQFGRSFLTRRVRFVWVMREYAHLEWAASMLRLCLELLPPKHLRLEMYVTRVPRPTAAAAADGEADAPSTEAAPLDPTLQAMGLDAADLTQFAPDEDAPLRGEDVTINEHIMKEGKLRRARTRRQRSMRRPRATPDVPSAGAAEHAATQADQDLAAMDQRPLSEGPPLVPPTPGWSSPVLSPMALPKQPPTSSYFPVPAAAMSQETLEPLSLSGPALPVVATRPSAPSPLLPEGTLPRPESTLPRPVSTLPFLHANLDPDELHDYNVLSELTRAGYPPLDTILGEEMGHAEGRTIAVGCGPAGLMTLLRATVSRHMSWRQVWTSRAAGHANLFTESYET